MRIKALINMISCDTSFLYSLYLVDAHTPKARTRLQKIRPPEGLILSPFHQYELPNAIRLSVFRGSQSGPRRLHRLHDEQIGVSVNPEASALTLLPRTINF